MTLPSITEYLNLVQMNAPRSVLAYDQIRRRAIELGDDRLVRLLDNARELAEEVSRLATARRTQSEARGDDDDDEFDKRMDASTRRLVIAVRETDQWMQRTRHPDRLRLRRLVDTHCPVGPGDIVSQRYEEQLHRSRAFVADLRGPYADLIDVIECERKLSEVEGQLDGYADALRARPKVSAVEVRDVARAMHEKTAIIVAHIIATYWSDHGRMQSMLLPIADQQARIRAILKARRAGQSVGDDPSRDDDDILDVEGADGEMQAPDDLDPLMDASGPIDAPADGAEAGADGEGPPAAERPVLPLPGGGVRLPVIEPLADGDR